MEDAEVGRGGGERDEGAGVFAERLAHWCVRWSGHVEEERDGGESEVQREDCEI
jgi:hypothetical protein